MSPRTDTASFATVEPCPSWHVRAFPLLGVELPPRVTGRGCHAEVAMQDELAARQRAVTLRLAGRPIKAICTALGRSEVWFHKWWRRYLQSGPDGLYDLTHANHHVAQHISPE